MNKSGKFVGYYNDKKVYVTTNEAKCGEYDMSVIVSGNDIVKFAAKEEFKLIK